MNVPPMVDSPLKMSGALLILVTTTLLNVNPELEAAPLPAKFTKLVPAVKVEATRLVRSFCNSRNPAPAFSVPPF
jgi:hypothetical protein